MSLANRWLHIILTIILHSEWIPEFQIEMVFIRFNCCLLFTYEWNGTRILISFIQAAWLRIWFIFLTGLLAYKKGQVLFASHLGTCMYFTEDVMYVHPYIFIADKNRSHYELRTFLLKMYVHVCTPYSTAATWRSADSAVEMLRWTYWTKYYAAGCIKDKRLGAKNPPTSFCRLEMQRWSFESGFTLYCAWYL